jgi:Family of unknown function (DUF6263)
MNVWRWLGLFVFLAAVTCFVGARMPAYAGGKDKDVKDKKVDKDKKDDKKDDKKGGDTLKFSAFAPDSKKFYQEVKTETTQVMEVMGQKVTQTQVQTFYIEWTPQPKKGDDFVVKQKVVGVKMEIDIGGNKINYDSTAAKQPQNPMTDFFNALMKQELTFVIAPGSGAKGLEVKGIEGRKEFINSLAETNPAIKTLLETIMSESALQKMAEPTWWAIPTKAVSKGDTWERTSDLDLGPIGKYDTKFNFTYEGPDANKLDKIKIDAKLTYSEPKDKDKAGLPFTIKTAKLESKSGTGEALFDGSKGRIASSSLKMKLEGTLTIEVGNMATEIKLNQDQVSTTKTTDTNPVAAADTKK